jgi:hypothetical protein
MVATPIPMLASQHEAGQEWQEEWEPSDMQLVARHVRAFTTQASCGAMSRAILPPRRPLRLKASHTHPLGGSYSRGVGSSWGCTTASGVSWVHRVEW